MSALARFEEFIEDLLEGSLSQLLRSPVQPAEIAKRLERAMEMGQRAGAGKVLVPTRYAVFLHPDDFAAFSPARSALEREMARFIVEQARERGFSLLSRPRVSLEARPGVRRHKVLVQAEFAESGEEETAELDLTPLQSRERLPQARLLYRDPAGRPCEVLLNRPEVTLGRARDNDVILDDPRVSRHHARIVLRYGQFVLQDLGSTYGTQVNGEPVQDCLLRSGDCLSLGGVELYYQEY